MYELHIVLYAEHCVRWGGGMKHILDFFEGYQVVFRLVGWGIKIYVKIEKKP